MNTADLPPGTKDRLLDQIQPYREFLYPAFQVTSKQAALEVTLNYLESEKIHLCLPNSEEYGLLNHIDSPPRLLFVLGNLAALNSSMFSIVGTRRPSPVGLRAALTFSKYLAGQKMTIVSGLARGIDGAAHEGALSAGAPTVAILGHGLDRIYPREHRALAQRIVDGGGCLVSEYPPFVPPLPAHFPQRNRIISGLSRGVLVVEAAERSGSLITARCAVDQGRDVFALPGNFDEKSYVGSHHLIQMGAKLVLTPLEILEELGWVPLGKELNSAIPGGRILYNLFEKLEKTASLEDLFLSSHLSFSELLQHLQEACAKGLVKEFAPQHFAWIDD